MFKLGRPAIRFAASLLLVTAQASLMHGSEPGPSIAKLFELGSKNTPPALAAAKSCYEKLKLASPRDRRIDYAFAVVLVNQHKYRDALPILTQYLEKGKPELDAVRVMIWAEVQDKKYSAAIDDMVLLSQRFTAANEDPMETAYSETARFLGTIFGYLELARPAALDSDAEAAGKKAVLSQLGEHYIPIFDEGRNAVAARLSGLQAERRAAHEQLVAAADAKKEQAQAALDEDRSKISVQQEAMQSHAENLREAERELSVVNNQLASLRTDRARLGAQIINLQAQLSMAQSQTQKFVDNTIPGDPRDVVVTQQVTAAGPFDPRTIQARAISISLATLNKQAFDMDRKIMAFQQRAMMVSGKGEQEAQTLAQRDAAVRQAAKHAKTIEKKLSREATPSKAPTAALTSQMTALPTYAPFPYAQEKKRVLGWFEKKL
jgi:hypothetical protein